MAAGIGLDTLIFVPFIVQGKIDSFIKSFDKKFKLRKMGWIIDPNCTVQCPINTICYRPIEYIEPEICVHLDYNFPEGLRVPTYQFQLLIIILIAIGLNFLLMVGMHTYQFRKSLKQNLNS